MDSWERKGEKVEGSRERKNHAQTTFPTYLKMTLETSIEYIKPYTYIYVKKAETFYQINTTVHRWDSILGSGIWWLCLKMGSSNQYMSLEPNRIRFFIQMEQCCGPEILVYHVGIRHSVCTHRCQSGRPSQHCTGPSLWRMEDRKILQHLSVWGRIWRLLGRELITPQILTLTKNGEFLNFLF